MWLGTTTKRNKWVRQSKGLEAALGGKVLAGTYGYDGDGHAKPEQTGLLAKLLVSPAKL